MTDVLVLGDAIVDAVFAGLDRYPDRGEELVAPSFELRPGGSAGYASLGLAALGSRPAAVTYVGDDVLSTHWRTFLDARGVDTSRVVEQPDATVSVAAGFLFDSDRSFVTHRGAMRDGAVPAVTPDGFDALFVAGLSQAPYLWGDDVVAVAREFAARGRPVFLDTNWSPGDWLSTAEALLPHVETLFANDAEARRLSGCDDLSDAAETLVADGASACVVKAGDRGCLVADDRSGTTWIETEPVASVDACGAGDFFDAGFIHARLAGADRPAAAAVANRCARAAITNFELRAKLGAIADLSE
ncbi:carbohydrate kinase family protein [Haloferax denitrificans]|uniref:PfkB domain-containing protein n=1 Tax=Haloferax denitrificans ATCC 35960 TaxID=662478 RepID=M0JCN1_9EURY|nr:carbohydrate kinase family protein [Haloferax denitrificans]EMA05779.1 PfkB domain-containing protein [Haloferax denitrificans ATCC 35960]